MLAGEARQQLQFIIFIFTSRRSQEPAKLQNGGSSFAIPLHFFSLPEQIRAGKKEETAGRSQLGGWESKAKGAKPKHKKRILAELLSVIL